MDWSEILGNFLAGVAVAFVVAEIAWLVTDRLAHRQQLAQAQERDDALTETASRRTSATRAWSGARPSPAGS